jgi:cobalt-zinc-cadmium efflux system membrane fusion protein
VNSESRLHLRPIVVVVAAAIFIAVGAAITYVAMKPTDPGPMATGVGGASTEPDPASPQTSARPASDTVTVTLTPEAIKRAGIEVEPVTLSSAAGRVRVPGTVRPIAYRTTVVTSLVGGRITRVSAELGQAVGRGQMLAEVYSPELAEAQTRFITSRAELEAHDRELRRTERLVEIGAASRQDLERIHAEHTAATTMVQSFRSRLTLLGLSDAQIASLAVGSGTEPTVRITSPLDGVVTERQANPGMNVDPSVPLFTVADLSSVWIVGDLNERDLARVRIGSPVTIAAPSIPGSTREGKVSYIDPQITADTRTAQLRVEIPNPGQQLRLGIYVDMEVREVGTNTAVTVPRSALQTAGNRSVVYIAPPGQPGQFVERTVEPGEIVGESVQIRSGLSTGDLVVTKGSFAVRSEAERVGTSSRTAADARQQVRIVVSDKGFEPARITLRAGVPARLTFLRTTDATCATEVLVPSLNIKRALPLNEPVEIEVTPDKPGDIAFACGMAMFSGTLVVQ